jgi:ankyrin repeat protein
MNNTHSFFTRLCHSPIPQRAAVTLIALAWSSLAFCGEIHDAASKGDLEKVKALLNGNADLVFSKDEDSHTPLYYAVNTMRKDMVELLLAKGANVNAKENYGWTPLCYAAGRCNKVMVEVLLANKADPEAENNDGQTPLHNAAQIGCKEVVELLLANKAKVNAEDHYGMTPLHSAAYGGRKDVVELLLASKAEVDAKDSIGETPLDRAARESCSNSERYKEVAELLLVNHANVNAKDEFGNTPLHDACDTKKMVQLLLTYGADVNAKNNAGMTPLSLAVYHLAGELKISENMGVVGSNSKDMIELLLANHADVNELAKLVTDSKDIWVRRAALSTLSDQTQLMQFAGTLPEAELRVTAVRKIADEKFLLARSREDSSAAVRTAAVMAMKSPDALLGVATNSYYRELRELAASNPAVNSTARGKIHAANEMRDKEIKNNGVKNIPQSLADIALNGKFDTVRLGAVKYLSDQSLLAKVAMKSTDREVTKAAFARLTDSSTLGEVANCADDPAVRIAAEIAQNMTTWRDVFTKAARVGESKALGDALAAVSLSKAQSGINNIVTETCLMLIRRGDESRIPELSDLLNLYGDKSLCEDYLNCGQPDLKISGTRWAYGHGYNVDTGNGSSRARWGSGGM